MSLNSTPSGERIHIGIFGRRNAGKSSLINALTGQELAIVSDTAGTTTDPVSKAMELLPLGPVVITDTPGIDDVGELGGLRVEKSYQAMRKTDIALLVVDAAEGEDEFDKAVEDRLVRRGIPYIKVYNKSDTINDISAECENIIYVSALKNINIDKLKNMIALRLNTDEEKKPVCSDLIGKGDFVVLVVPIDKAAPKGRLILPQQQTIRDILDTGCTAIVCRDNELEETLASLAKKPSLVITDSQVFKKVADIVACDIPLTSFSILFARYKGDLELNVKGVKTLDTLCDGDTVLISEGCTHHRQCGDIGTVKLPAMIRKYTEKDISFQFTSGGSFTDTPEKYKLIVHCGGCMLNEREMRHRISCACEAAVPMTNYGICIAYMQGILERSVQPFDNVRRLLGKEF